MYSKNVVKMRLRNNKCNRVLSHCNSSIDDGNVICVCVCVCVCEYVVYSNIVPRFRIMKIRYSANFCHYSFSVKFDFSCNRNCTMAKEKPHWKEQRGKSEVWDECGKRNPYTHIFIYALVPILNAYSTTALVAKFLLPSIFRHPRN